MDEPVVFRRAAICGLRFLGVLAAFGGGSTLGIGLFMAGAGPAFIAASLLWVLYLVCGLVVGICLPRWWYIAIGVAWFPLMLAPEFLGEVVAGIASLEGIMFLSCPLVALVGGYTGRKTRRWFTGSQSAA